MPNRPLRPCKSPRCPNLTDARSGYCIAHVCKVPDPRPSAAKRGYGAGWRQIRERTLRLFGIPMKDWHLYAIDHRPPYDPAIEPDHTKYTLIPMLISEHSRKTAGLDGGFRNPKATA